MQGECREYERFHLIPDHGFESHRRNICVFVTFGRCVVETRAAVGHLPGKLCWLWFIKTAMARSRHHSHGKKGEDAHVAKEDRKAEREQHDSDSEQNDQAADGQIDKKAQPATYTAMTVDGKALEEAPPAGAIVGAGYDQQDGITKAVGITLPPDSCPDQQPGVPNVPIAAMVVAAAPPAVPGENSPLPDQQPGVPNVPVAVVTDGSATASQNATSTAVNDAVNDAVHLTQLPR
jgi:hypothetical protein